MIRTEDELRQMFAARADTAVSERDLQAWLHGPGRRPRRALLPALAAAAVIAVALAAAWVGGAFGSGRTSPPAGQSSPPTKPVAQGVQGAFWDPEHPDVLQLVVMIGYPANGSACLDSRIVSVADQTATSVTIDVAPPSGQPAELPRVCTPSVQVPHVAVHLDAPLDGRAVIDALSMRPVTVVSVADVPRPSTVPAGYAPEPLALTLEMIGPAGEVDGGRVELTTHPRVDASHVGAVRSYRDGDKVLEIRTGPADSAYDPARLGGDNHAPFDVDGHPGHVDILPGSTDTICVSWQPTSDRATEVCSEDDPLHDGPPGPAPLTADEVIDIAQHLH